MPLSEGDKDKTFAEMLRHASIADQLRIPYPRGPLDKPPAVDADPGRFRNAAFFAKIYGDCKTGEVVAAPRLHSLAAQNLGQTDQRHGSEPRRRASARRIGGDRHAARANQTRRLPDRRHLQVPCSSGHRTAERAQLRHRHRSQYSLLGLLVLATAWWLYSLSQSHAASRSSRSSKSTDLFGAGSGTTSIRCTSNFDPSSLRRTKTDRSACNVAVGISGRGLWRSCRADGVEEIRHFRFQLTALSGERLRS